MLFSGSVDAGGSAESLDRLRRIREHAHKTQTQLAGEIGVTPQMISAVELGQSKLPDALLHDYARAVGVVPEALVQYSFTEVSSLRAKDPLRLWTGFKALYSIASVYGLSPRYSDGIGYLLPTTQFMAGAIREWEGRYKSLCAAPDSNREEYEVWKCRFAPVFNQIEFPAIYPEYNPAGEGAAGRWKRDRVSKKIAGLRRATGLSCKDFAAAHSISPFTLGSYEQGRRIPKFKQAFELSEAFGIDPQAFGEFFFGSPVGAAHALFALANEIPFFPSCAKDGTPVLAPQYPSSATLFALWAEAAADPAIKGNGDLEPLEEWADRNFSIDFRRLKPRPDAEARFAAEDLPYR